MRGVIESILLGAWLNLIPWHNIGTAIYWTAPAAPIIYYTYKAILDKRLTDKQIEREDQQIAVMKKKRRGF